MAPRIGDLRARPGNPDVWDRWDGEQWRFHCWPTARAVSIDLRGVMLHLWVRHCRRRLRWGYTLRVRGRYLLFGGRR